MPSAMISRGWLAPLIQQASAGASGVNVPLDVENDDGPQAGVDLSGAGVIRVSVDGGKTWANRVGAAPVEGEDGVYRYTADATEVAAAQTTGFLLVKFKKATYHQNTQRADVNDQQLADALLTITNAITSSTTTLEGDIVSTKSQINDHTDAEVTSAVTTIDAAIATAETAIIAEVDAKAAEIDTRIDSTDAAIDAAIAAAQAAIVSEIDATAAATVAEVDAQATAIDDHVDASIAAAQAAIVAEVDATTAAIDALVRRLLGLHGDNSLIDGGPGFPSMQYNVRRVLTVARIRTFADATALAAATPGANDGDDDEIFRWYIAGTDNGSGLDATFARSRSL